MILIIKYKNGVRSWICVIDIYSKYAWIVSLKDKGGITVKNSPLKVLDESGCKPDKA